MYSICQSTSSQMIVWPPLEYDFKIYSTNTVSRGGFISAIKSLSMSWYIC